MTLFGKTHVTTRQIVWMGDTDADYQYSGHTRQTIPWSDIVFHVKQYVEKALADIGIAAHFNTCLLNYYPTGTDGMGYHADDEKRARSSTNHCISLPWCHPQICL
ncbi:alpha-ketoglutarate-dependent dioxygenase AlkB [Psychrobacter sp. KH172YL61]|uniref:alpha-ketoglutarate-dependent dioxygenase AlkB n=1 Tax=Psychrobacter sp. KH172YL61 TaxID=2517899 RepID=UPI002FCD043B